MAKRKIEPADAVQGLDVVWYGMRFPSDFVYDRPFGAGDDAIHFFHFRNEVILLDENGETARAAGSAILYAPGVRQRFQGIASSEKPLLCDHVCFSGSMDARLRKHGIPINRAFTVTEPQSVMETVLNLRTEERKARSHWRSAMQAYRSVLMLQLAREATMVPGPSVSERGTRVEQIMRDVCAMIDRNPAQPWVVAELAQIAGMSRGRFSAQFKQVTDSSPQDYAINARLREARMLLTNTSLTVSEVAERCGFRSAYYMSRLFSSRIGCPPSRYAERFHVATP